MKLFSIVLLTTSLISQELFVDAIGEKPLNINGHFVHYDLNDSYGWAYFMLDNEVNPQSVKGVYKLEGVDKTTGKLLWSKIDNCATDYQLSADAQMVTISKSHPETTSCGITSDIFKQEHYPVNGHFIHYASQAYDWAYLFADTLQVAKLTGFKRGKLTWELFEDAIFEDITLSQERSNVTFSKRENRVGKGGIQTNPYGMFGPEVRFGNHLLTGTWTLATLAFSTYTPPSATAIWEFNANGTWTQRCSVCNDFNNEVVMAEGAYGVDESAKQLKLYLKTIDDTESNLTQTYEAITFEDGCYLLHTMVQPEQSDYLLMCKTLGWTYDFVFSLKRSYLESLFSGINAGNPMNNSGYFGPNVTLAGHHLADRMFDVYTIDENGTKKQRKMQYYFTSTGAWFYRNIKSTSWLEGEYGVDGSGKQLLDNDIYRKYASRSNDPACFYLTWYDAYLIKLATSLQCESNETLPNAPLIAANHEHIRYTGSKLQLLHESSPTNPGIALLIKHEYQLLELLESDRSELLDDYSLRYTFNASNIDFKTQNLIVYRRYIPACPANVVEADPVLLENGDYLIQYVEGKRSEFFHEEHCSYSPGSYTEVTIAYIVDKTIPHIIFRLENGAELIIDN